MNLCLEYLIRTETIKDFLMLPCSLFLESDEEQKKVVVFSKKRHHICTQEWDVSPCNPQHVLPPMKEFVISSVFEYKIPLPFYPLRYQASSVPRYYGSRHPIEQQVYEYCVDNQLTSKYHQITRRVWLWATFLKTYKLFQLNTSEMTQYAIKMKHPKKWRFWEIWEKYLMPQEEGVSAELIFSAL